MHTPPTAAAAATRSTSKAVTQSPPHVLRRVPGAAAPRGEGWGLGGAARLAARSDAALAAERGFLQPSSNTREASRPAAGTGGEGEASPRARRTDWANLLAGVRLVPATGRAWSKRVEPAPTYAVACARVSTRAPSRTGYLYVQCIGSKVHGSGSSAVHVGRTSPASPRGPAGPARGRRRGDDEGRSGGHPTAVSGPGALLRWPAGRPGRRRFPCPRRACGSTDISPLSRPPSQIIQVRG
eukprot:scaffold84_cov388-Prasinococcus_capsulatus_cf.AAC.18